MILKGEIMDWCDVDDVLYEGDKKDILALRCPDCGRRFKYVYSPRTKNMEIRCSGCGYFSRAYGNIVPNCYRLLGEQAVV